MGGSARVPGVRVVRPRFVFQRGGGREGAGGGGEEEVPVGGDGGRVRWVWQQEVPSCCVRGQEGHVGGQEATVEGVHPGEDSSHGGDAATRQRVVMGEEVARVGASWGVEGRGDGRRRR